MKNFNKFLKIGHRGAKGHQMENTLSSFRKAKELNVDIIELDVHLTKDNKLVVFHDDTLKRMTNQIGKVTDKTLFELKKIKLISAPKHIKSKFPQEQIPTLEEAVRTIGPEKIINIELKGKDTAEPVYNFIKNLVNQNTNFTFDNFIISSFKTDELNKFIKINIDQKIKTGKLFYWLSTGQLFFISPKKLGVDFIIIHKYALWKKTLIKKIHRYNLKIFIHPVNSPRQIKKLKQLGVDGIFSDYPERL